MDRSRRRHVTFTAEGLFLFVLWIISQMTRLSQSMQVTLLDTTKLQQTDSLNWVTYSRTDEPNRRGWREGSYTTGDVVDRVYTVCNVAVAAADNWLRTPYVARGEANRLYVDMKFTMRRCIKYPEPGRLQQCKESFKLLYYEAESDFANTMRPSWDENAYRHVDVIAADDLFAENNELVINAETRSVPVTRRGVYFAFYDQGACTTLLSVRIYYVACPAVTINFARFSETPAGPEMTSIDQRDGICVEHAEIDSSSPPSYLCKADGSWYYPTGRCRCMPGYQPNDDGTLCIACPPSTYKWQSGSDRCQPCPEQSEALQNATTECKCMDGFYRHPDDDKSQPCTSPPSEVRDLVVAYRNQSTVHLHWKSPVSAGGRPDLRYSIECTNCDSSVVYIPQKTNFNSTSAFLTNLNSNTRYKITVYAVNGVSRVSGISNPAHVDVVTNPAVPPKVFNMRIVSIGANYITIAWDSPPSRRFEIDSYEVSYYTEGSENMSFELTRQPNITLENLQQQTKYAFKVRARGNSSYGEYSDLMYGTTGLISQHLHESPVGIIAGSAVAVVLCMLIVIIMVVIFLRRNHRAYAEKNSGECDALHYNTVHCPHVIDGTHTINGTLTLPMYMPAGSIRTYVDPYTYEDPNQAVREFAKEIDTSFITIESVIGGGEFGDVCRGRLLREPGGETLNVAIKTLKAGASDKNRLDFLTEASIMGQFDDPNVIYLEGVVTRSNPIMIVTEFMENGSLDSFLRNNDGQFTILQLVGMLRGIASGMRYLSDMGYVHRDLAARNILVSETLVCKVADFGLSREIENDGTDGEYTTKGGKIPVRWTAPEAIAFRKFTSASDVWSYGVVTWEVISYGERPYWNWSNHDVINAINRGFTLPPPMDCPEAIYQLMIDCWQRDRSCRPRFSVIVKCLDRLIRAPELLRNLAKPRPQCSQLLTQTTDSMEDSAVAMSDEVIMSDLPVTEWLASIKMDRYAEQFVSSGLSIVDDVVNLTLKDLVNLGVTLVGHQKKIMNSIQSLRAQRQHTLDLNSSDLSPNDPNLQATSVGYLV